MSSPALEMLLARLYTDQDLRDRFLRDPWAVIDQERQGAAGSLTDDEARGLLAIDSVGLQMAAASYAGKRAARAPDGRRGREVQAKPGARTGWRFMIRRFLHQLHAPADRRDTKSAPAHRRPRG